MPQSVGHLPNGHPLYKNSTHNILTFHYSPLLYLDSSFKPPLKFSATILLTCLLVYLLEMVALTAFCHPASSTHKEASCKKKSATTCHQVSENGHCKKDPPGKNTDCNTTNCCMNCPLTYVATLGLHHLPGKKESGSGKIEYELYRSYYNYLYYAYSWKPPDYHI